MIGSRTHGVQEDPVVQPEAAGIGPVRDTQREFLQLFASIAHREPCDMPACHCTEQVLLYCCTHCGVTLCFPTPSTKRLGILALSFALTLNLFGILARTIVQIRSPWQALAASATSSLFSAPPLRRQRQDIVDMTMCIVGLF